MLPEELNAIAEKERAARKQICIRCCMSAGCLSSQSDEIKKTLERSVAERQLSDRVEIRRVGCMGLCGQGPLVKVEPDGVMYRARYVEKRINDCRHFGGRDHRGATLRS